MARPRISPELQTVQRTYRFNQKLFDDFEYDCARNLANPKHVLEALILHWLESKPTVRSAIAEKHHKRFGVTPTED